MWVINIHAFEQANDVDELPENVHGILPGSIRKHTSLIAFSLNPFVPLRLSRYHNPVLLHRVISSAVMVTALSFVFYFDGRLEGVDPAGTLFEPLFLGALIPAGLVMWVAMTLLIALATPEVVSFFHAKGVAVSQFLIMSGAIGGCGLFYFTPNEMGPQTALAMVATGLMVLFVWALVKHGGSRNASGGLVVASATVFGAFYLAIAPLFYLGIRQWYSPWVIAAVIVVVKSCDVGAYFVGRAVGRHKLIFWLSPGKTWEGLAGGVGVSAAVCVTLVALAQSGQASAWNFPCPLWFAAVAGAGMGLAGQLGDLTVSFFKRDAGLKDSGNRIPGFGGFLDVFDSLILVAPLVYWLLAIVAIIK